MSSIDDGTVLSRILHIIGRRLDLAPQAIDPEASVVRDLGADSLDILMIAGEIEGRFQVRIPDEMIEGAETPAEIARRLQAHLEDVEARK